MIIIISLICNCFRTKKIGCRYGTVMWIAGLRGPVSFALALIAPLMSSLFVGTTLIVVFLTTVVLGGLTGVVLGEFAHLGLMDVKTPLTTSTEKTQQVKVR